MKVRETLVIANWNLVMTVINSSSRCGGTGSDIQYLKYVSQLRCSINLIFIFSAELEFSYLMLFPLKLQECEKGNSVFLLVVDIL